MNTLKGGEVHWLVNFLFDVKLINKYNKGNQSYAFINNWNG